MDFEYVAASFSLILLGLVPAIVASRKGQSFTAWWIYGSALLIVALPHALWMKRKTSVPAQPGQKECAYCQEWMEAEDEICPSCHFHVYDPMTDGPTPIAMPTHHAVMI